MPLSLQDPGSISGEMETGDSRLLTGSSEALRKGAGLLGRWANLRSEHGAHIVSFLSSLCCKRFITFLCIGLLSLSRRLHDLAYAYIAPLCGFDHYLDDEEMGAGCCLDN